MVTLEQDCYSAFLWMMHEWRHVRLLKWMGHGHSASGVRGMQEGKLAILCLACPIPNINLLLNWRATPKSDQYVILLLECALF